MNELDMLASQLVSFITGFSREDLGARALAAATSRAVETVRARRDLERLEKGTLKRVLREQIRKELLEEGEVRRTFTYGDRKFALTLLRCWNCGRADGIAGNPGLISPASQTECSSEIERSVCENITRVFYVLEGRGRG